MRQEVSLPSRSSLYNPPANRRYPVLLERRGCSAGSPFGADPFCALKGAGTSGNMPTSTARSAPSHDYPAR
jgi:hypothetical protein